MHAAKDKRSAGFAPNWQPIDAACPLAGSVLVQADLVPVKTPTLELDRSALLAARRELRDRVNRGTAVVSDLDGNRLAVFTTNTRTLLPPRGHPYSLPLLCAVSALFVATALVIAASVWVAKKHLTPTPVSPSIEEGAGPRPESASEFLALVPARLLSSRLTGPTSAATLQLLERKVPRREPVPEPPVYLPPPTSTLVETSVAPSTANGTLGGWSTSPETVTPGTTAHSSREWLSTRSTSFQTEKSYSEASRPETVAK
ncbi:hypothetical protein IscW_ISCW010000 [Ixodes scapularis]|uniref:Uncharacterized protein n=1 Tax=Ixodes scapularis TaxID=6945 RepID=B7Q033_IXOSC|nr:hypothetical protein IscW_ISCW010000 [Ixodes scapularis]|eukprot:XP_002406764.1 hypothetical protein IscW_ISCW010000 [Ixodes scapularis]